MITLHEKIEVNRPVEEAFAYLADFRTSEQWDSTVISATKLSSGPIGGGTRFEVICRQPLGRLRFAYTLTHCEPGRLLRLHGRGRFFDVDDEIHFAETASGTLIDYRATFTFKGRLDALAGRFRTGLQQMGYNSVQGLKRALEDNFPVPELSLAGRRGQRLIIPAIADFTRFGYTRGRKRWLPVSRWMGNKHVVITGASAGLGLAAAQRLAELGAELTLVIRNESRALELKQAIERETGNSRIHIEIADLSLMADVDRLVRRMQQSGKPIDVLVNNAGALFNPREETSEGLERSFALLLLSPFRLTRGPETIAGQGRPAGPGDQCGFRGNVQPAARSGTSGGAIGRLLRQRRLCPGQAGTDDRHPAVGAGLEGRQYRGQCHAPRLGQDTGRGIRPADFQSPDRAIAAHA